MGNLRRILVSATLAGATIVAMAGCATAAPTASDAVRMPVRPHSHPVVTYTVLNQTSFAGRTFKEIKNNSNGQIHAQLLDARGKDQIATYLCLKPRGERLLGLNTNPAAEKTGTRAVSPSQRGISYKFTIAGKVYNTSATLGAAAHVVRGSGC